MFSAGSGVPCTQASSPDVSAGPGWKVMGTAWAASRIVPSCSPSSSGLAGVQLFRPRDSAHRGWVRASASRCRSGSGPWMSHRNAASWIRCRRVIMVEGALSMTQRGACPVACRVVHLITAAQRRHELTRVKPSEHCASLTRLVRQSRSKPSPEKPRSLAPGSTPKQTSKTRSTGSARAKRSPNPPRPSRQRATEASLLRRLEIANDRNRKLTEENARLRRQLERALGQLRADSVQAVTAIPKR
jgi:hypothetical protein